MVVREKPPEPMPVPAGEVTITVGIHGEEGSAQHRGANDTGVPLTVLDVATFNEFGTSRTPQRSFIRAWYDEDREFIDKTLKSQFALALAGKITNEVAMERCALAFEGRIKQRIARGIPPPNAPSTIARKKSSTPLIDKGQLRNAIRGKAVLR
jgi:hypothetical protein